MRILALELARVAVVFAAFGVSGAVLPNPPQRWSWGHPILSFQFYSPRGKQFTDADEKTLKAEMLDTNFFKFVANAIGVTEAQCSNLVLAPNGSDLWCYSVKKTNDPADDQIVRYYMAYAKARYEGHSRACLYEALTNTLAVSNITNAELRDLVTNLLVFPASYFRHTSSGEYGKTTPPTIISSDSPSVIKLSRWADFVMVDGPYAWQYRTSYTENGKFHDVSKTKIDAKELDPKYIPVFKEVAKEVEAEMKQNGSDGKLGSVHIFWLLKQEKLKARGIDWLSPSELNTDRIYD
jgi:hypothetical protein